MSKSENAVVAFLDILGMGPKMRDAPDVAHDYLIELVRLLNDNAELERTSMEVQLIVLSDSVYLNLPVQRGILDSTSDIEIFGRFISRVLSQAYLGDIPLRGAISVGRSIVVLPDGEGISQNHISGRPVWETVEFEKYQNWIGVSVVPSNCLNESDIPKYKAVVKILMEKKLVTLYQVPVKGDSPGQVYALCWPKKNVEKVKELLSAECLLYKDNNPGIAKKYENTLKFLKHHPDAIHGGP